MKAVLLNIIQLLRWAAETAGWCMAVLFGFIYASATDEPSGLLFIVVLVLCCLLVIIFEVLKHGILRARAKPQQREEAKAMAATAQAQNEPLPEKPRQSTKPGSRPQVAPWQGSGG